MFLSRIHLNPRAKEVRRDLADPYQLHATLCRAFNGPEEKCAVNEFLWRLEPETSQEGYPRVLTQGRTIPDWRGIGVKGWLADSDPSIDLVSRLNLGSLTIGSRFRFRLRANPCVTRDRKRLGLLRTEEQETWLQRKGVQHGFSLPGLPSLYPSDQAEEKRVDVQISHEQMLRGKQHSGNPIRIFSVQYDGMLTVTDPDKFRRALQTGIGHGKVMGLGLLSIAPIE